MPSPVNAFFLDATLVPGTARLISSVLCVLLRTRSESGLTTVHYFQHLFSLLLLMVFPVSPLPLWCDSLALSWFDCGALAPTCPFAARIASGFQFSCTLFSGISLLLVQQAPSVSSFFSSWSPRDTILEAVVKRSMIPWRHVAVEAVQSTILEATGSLSTPEVLNLSFFLERKSDKPMAP